MRSKDTRIERMNKQLLRDFSELIRDELKLPETFKFLTITQVNLSPDMSSVKVHVSHLKDDQTEPCVQVLTQRTPDMRDRLRKMLAWRKIPMITFYADDSLKRGFEMIQKIDRLVRPAESRPDAGDAGDAEPAEPSEPKEETP